MVLVDKREHPSFMIDALPYYMPLFLMLWYYFSVQYFKHVFFGAWLIYFLSPIYNMWINNDVTNLVQKNERNFSNTKMFLVPIHAFIYVEAALHIYTLILFSTKYKPDFLPEIFEYVPNQTLLQFVLFVGTKSFFCAVGQMGGHELYHRRELINKIVGSIPLTYCMMTYYWDEHLHSHHKDVATPLDPACSAKGCNTYASLCRSAYGVHVKTWKREESRILKSIGVQSWMYTLMYNKMIIYTIFHFL
jgi:hypothetical protein